MIIKSRLTEKDFINVNFTMWLRRPLIKILIGIYGLIFLSGLISLIFSKAHLSQVLATFLFITLLPILIYFAAKRNYASNKRISETIEYKFEKDVLIVTGESFNSQLTWDKVYKVTKTKNWLVIWQNRQVANVIPNRDLQQSSISELKKILSVHRVKNNL